MRAEDVYSEAMELWETGPAKTRVDRLLQFFTLFYLRDDILTKVDRASMMSSLETRAVFLDNDLVEFCRRYRTGLNRSEKISAEKGARTLAPCIHYPSQKEGVWNSFGRLDAPHAYSSGPCNGYAAKLD